MNHEEINRFMEQGTADGVFPGAVLRVSESGTVIYEKAFGVTDIDEKTETQLSTVFDLASLTKPLAGAVSIMILIQQGKLEIDSALGQLIPSFNRTDKKNLTVRQLLCHTSGLPAYKPYYLKLADAKISNRLAMLKAMLLEETPVRLPDVQAEYSDIGFMIINWVIETCSGMSICDFVQKEVFNPLGIRDLFYIGHGMTSDALRVYASTERCAWRNKTLKGEVHDHNAWIMDGHAAHAGLFGTAEAVDSLLSEILAVYHGDRVGSVFNRSVVRMFLSECGNFRRTPGFDMPSESGSSSGSRFSKTSVGHLGYTGTSFWMDIEQKIIVTLLTNRVHPDSGNIKIRTFRPLIHDLVKCLKKQ